MSANDAVETLQSYSDRIRAACKRLGWKKDWASGGCYLHLEASEFIEALRGKGENPCPTSEAADVLVALFAVTSNYKIPISDILERLEATISYIEQRPIS